MLAHDDRIGGLHLFLLGDAHGRVAMHYDHDACAGRQSCLIDAFMNLALCVLPVALAIVLDDDVVNAGLFLFRIAERDKLLIRRSHLASEVLAAWPG